MRGSNKQRHLLLISSCALAGSIGYVVSSRLLFAVAPQRGMSDRAPGDTGRPPGVVTGPRMIEGGHRIRLPSIALPGPGSAMAAQDSLFLEHREAAQELRGLVETQLWDLAATALHDCEHQSNVDMSCWIRLAIRTHQSYLTVSARDPLQCHDILPDNNIVRAPEQDETAMMRCLIKAIAPFTELGAPVAFDQEAGAYAGPLDVNFELTPDSAR